MVVSDAEKSSRISVSGSFIDALDWESACSQIEYWSRRRESRTVCICNTHSIVSANDDPSFQKIINEADMATPDGAPVAWYMRLRGIAGQSRISGPDLMWKVCERLNASQATSIFLYGSDEQTNSLVAKRLHSEFPSLKIAGSYSPPFRPLSLAEMEASAVMINESGAGLIWVSLGCPKQERWMAQQKGRVAGVMIGVGAAFDYHAGVIRRAPALMQRCGLEWFFRLISEPRRLWRRYLYNNTKFLYLAAISALAQRRVRF